MNKIRFKGIDGKIFTVQPRSGDKLLTGVNDSQGKEICLGDMLRIDLYDLTNDIDLKGKHTDLECVYKEGCFCIELGTGEGCYSCLLSDNLTIISRFE